MADKYSSKRPHKLCLWEPDGDNRMRETTYKNAVVINGRWFEGQHQVVNSAGKLQTANHSAFVDRDIPLGSYLRKGTIGGEIDKTKDPRDYAGLRPSDAHVVVSFYKVWDSENVPFRSVSMT